MKKSLIVVAILLVIITLLPVVGNSVIKKTIDERVVTLSTYGIETQKDESNSSYLSTSRHFEFLLKDSKKFVSYMSQYSDKQIPPYLNAILDGVLIGVDVTYSNLPFAKAVEIELYPIALDKDTQAALRVEDNNVYSYVEKLLANKTVLYHINYNFLNDDFDGYIKDIKEGYTTKDKIKVSFVLEKAKFSGNGPLLAPKVLSSKLKEFHFEASQDGKEVLLSLKKFSAKSNFASKNTYLSSADLENMVLVVQGTRKDLRMNLDKARLNLSSNSLDKTAELNSKGSVGSFSIQSETLKVDMKKFNLDVALSQLNKENFEAFQLLLSEAELSQEPQLQVDLQRSALKLISSGFLLNIADFSLKSLILNNQNFEGFKLKSTTLLKEDPSLSKQIQSTPVEFLKNLDVDTSITMSKKIYALMVQNNGMLAMLHTYAKEIGDSYLFDIKFKDSKITINDKQL